MLTKYKNVSCNKFIQLKRKEIQSLADSGHSLFDIYNYYKSKYILKWNDCACFGVYCKKNGITYSPEARQLVNNKRYKKPQ